MVYWTKKLSYRISISGNGVANNDEL